MTSFEQSSQDKQKHVYPVCPRGRLVHRQMFDEVLAERDRLREINRELIERLSSISNKVSDDPDDYPDSQLYQMMQREVIEANLTLAHALAEKEER